MSPCRDRSSSRSRSPASRVLKTWFEERKATYAAPEYRKIAYVKLDPEAHGRSVGDQRRAGEEGLRRRTSSRYTTPETRKIEQLVFPSAEAAKAAFDSTRTGATFDDLVKAAGKTMADVQLGTFAKAQVPDPAIADAAFKLGANEISQVVAGLVRPGAAARHRDQRPKSSSRSTEVADADPQGAGGGRGDPHPARRA